jgi:dihydrodiol dehydrogenase / D-xylose 1-dehydrogenase (NADP)
MQSIRWGIIGAGKISSQFATALNSLENTELVAVASRELSKAQQFAEQYQIKKAYGSYEELVQDPDIDVVYIGTPHTEHKSNAELCIEHHKAVLCEKPFTVNQKEAVQLIAKAEQHKVFLMEAMWTKFLPTTNTVKQWIESGAIGKIKYMNVSFGFQAEFDPKSRLFDPNLAGGALLDVGVYPITYVTYMMGRMPDEVVGRAYFGASHVDELDVIIMRYHDGVLADVSCAVSANTGNTAIIVGEKGKIVVLYFWCATTAELYDLNGKLINTFSLPHASNGYEYEAEEVNRCLREGKTQSDILPLCTTLDIIKIMDKLRADWGLVYPTE